MSYNRTMDLYSELIAVIDLLNAEGIEYAVCGGIAVALHGYVRFTHDLDILVRSEDTSRIAAAVKSLGFLFDAGRIPFGTTPNPREIHRISKLEGEDLLTLDLLLVDTTYQDVWEQRHSFTWEGRQLQVVSLEGLLKMKRIAGREKDLHDIRELLALKESRDA